MKTINFLLAGVGGQGTILAGELLAHVGLSMGFEAKKAEVHGMSQRGGSVTSHVRWGTHVFSPVAGAGEVDFLLAFEKLEGLRSIHMLRPTAIALINQENIIPTSVTSQNQVYPLDDEIHAAFAKSIQRAIFVDASDTAKALGVPQTMNVVLIGALAAVLSAYPAAEFTQSDDVWLDVIVKRVPAKYAELNKTAFFAGKTLITLPQKENV